MGLGWRMAAAVGTAVVLAGCSVGGLAPIGPVASVEPPAAPLPPSYGAFLDGPVGQKLSAADRDKARVAEEAALGSGQRKAWRGEGGVYGYVEPGAGPQPSALAADGGPAAAAAEDSCREFTSTIYIGGRPQVGRGRGCLTPGGYRIVG